MCVCVYTYVHAHTYHRETYTIVIDYENDWDKTMGRPGGSDFASLD